MQLIQKKGNPLTAVMLCKQCNSIDLEISAEPSHYVSRPLRIYASLDDLKVPAGSGRELCAMIWNDVKSLEETEDADLSLLFTTRFSKPDYVFQIRLAQRGSSLNI